MPLIPFLHKNRFLTQDEADMIVQAIQHAEKKTSGEIRVFIESRCRLVNPVNRAAEVFWKLKMDHTQERNGVLVYVASKDHQVAIFGDDGVHKIAGQDYWNDILIKLLGHFKANAYADGIRLVIDDIGDLLQRHFPNKPTTDKNELPDDIVFGN